MSEAAQMSEKNPEHPPPPPKSLSFFIQASVNGVRRFKLRLPKLTQIFRNFWTIVS